MEQKNKLHIKVDDTVSVSEWCEIAVIALTTFA